MGKNAAAVFRRSEGIIGVQSGSNLHQASNYQMRFKSLADNQMHDEIDDTDNNNVLDQDVEN